MSNNDKNENLETFKQVSNFINDEVKLGKSEEEIINYFVERGQSREEAEKTVANVLYLNVDYIEKQIALRKSPEDTIKDIIEKGADSKLANDMVLQIYALENLKNNFISNLEISNRIKEGTKRFELSQKGYSKMWRGAIICLVGVLITALTYSSPINNSYYICYGAIIFGAIDFIIGFSQWQGNK